MPSLRHLVHHLHEHAQNIWGRADIRALHSCQIQSLSYTACSLQERSEDFILLSVVLEKCPHLCLFIS